jgi:AraC family transcriptional regulator
MFLLYRNRGERHFGRDPIAPHPRKVWAFQFTLSGEASLFVREGNRTREERLVAPVLTVAGPECVHGYGGRDEDTCEIIVFHFDEADFSIRSVIGPDGHRSVKLTPRDIPTVRQLYDRCSEGSKSYGVILPPANKTLVTAVINGIVALELALFFLRHIPRTELGPSPDFGESKVAEATAWYEANLAGGPNIEDVAEAIHISPTHLRRLFHKVRGISPQAALTRIQFERAKWLMRDLAMPLERVAENSGFGSASAFSRAFKSEFGMSPKDYRSKFRKH